MNTFGRYFRLTTFGESHGPAIGGIVDGLPAGLHFDAEALTLAMARRNPAGAAGATKRREPDDVEILSGVYQGTTLGTPIGFVIRNRDARPTDYDAVTAMYRPNHADYTTMKRYGIRD
ncbi:MAG: chorismate synthase, partial [Roseburia sp.]|nr:chorismate synthase [Roseburia sp.]